MPRYRLPPGPGRPRGRKNTRTLLVGGRLDELVPDERLIRLLIQLAEGKKRKGARSAEASCHDTGSR